MPWAFEFAAYLIQVVGVNEENVLNDLREYLLKEGLSYQDDVSGGDTPWPYHRKPSFSPADSLRANHSNMQTLSSVRYEEPHGE